MNASNVDAEEIAKFEALAARWWDSEGEFRPLHMINPLRLDYIDAHAPLAGTRVADIGCGGGLLSEGMARRGATVTGVDMAAAALDVARAHAEQSGVEVTYVESTAEALADAEPAAFDAVTCLEMLEHVPDPATVVDACARLVKPGGRVFFSTINRNPKSYLLAIVGAEYVLRLVPRGTHEYTKFIKPSELDAWGRAAGLELEEVIGVIYNPLTGTFRLGSDIDVNYMMRFRATGGAA